MQSQTEDLGFFCEMNDKFVITALPYQFYAPCVGVIQYHPSPKGDISIPPTLGGIKLILPSWSGDSLQCL